MRTILVLTLFTVAAVAGVYTYRVATAERLASRVVHDYCRRHGYDTQKLVGPSKDDVPHTAAAYWWEYHDDSHNLRFFLAFHGFHALTEFGVYDEKTQQTHYPFEDGT